MDFQDFFRAAQEHLDVSWLAVTPLEGRRIDVGEEFDVKLSIRNTFDGGSGIPIFKNVELAIEGTAYAQPTGESVLRVAERLAPGETVYRVVRFRALAADPTEGSQEQEPIADVRLRARLDIEAMLDIEADSTLLRAQIHGGSNPE